MSVKHDAPLVVMSFNRPDYLRKFLESLKGQIGADMEHRTILLFQDGARNKHSSILHAKPEEISACFRVFQDVFPGQPVFEAESNLGVALNFDRAERHVFEKLAAEAAIFLEDDLVLSPHYINIIDHMLAAHSADARVGYVAAYGNHRLGLQEQRDNLRKLSAMHHNWGFGLYRRQWLTMRPYVEEYLKFVHDRDYRLRDHARITALFAAWGFGAPATSQDAAKTLACCLTRTIKINTVACFAQYIGERGLHMNPDEFRNRNYSATQVIPELVTEFDPITDAVYHEIRADLMDWAGKARLMVEEAKHVAEAEKLFHKVNSQMRENQRDIAPVTAAEAVVKMLDGLSADWQTFVRFYPMKELRDVANESHIRVDLRGGVLRILCPNEMLNPHYTNYFQAFVLMSTLFKGVAASGPVVGGFTMDVGHGSNVGSYPRVAFSSALPQATLVMEPEFNHTHGHERLRDIVNRTWVPWRNRPDIAFWRGSSTGHKSKPPATNGSLVTNWTWLQRLHLCDVAARSTHAARLDVGLSNVVQIGEAHLKTAITAANFIRGPVQDGDLLGYRYLFVLDGNTSAASGLFQALLVGACVLLVESRHGYRSWFYDRLVPWQTHVPIKADLSDMDERLEWIFSHRAECERIAAFGRELAVGMNFEIERQRSVEQIASILRS